MCATTFKLRPLFMVHIIHETSRMDYKNQAVQFQAELIYFVLVLLLEKQAQVYNQIYDRHGTIQIKGFPIINIFKPMMVRYYVLLYQYHKKNCQMPLQRKYSFIKPKCLSKREIRECRIKLYEQSTKKIYRIKEGVWNFLKF